MKNISVTLKGNIGKEVTTLATLWLIERTDGVKLGFTDFDEDIFFNGVNYVASTGISPSAVDESTSLKVDNMEVTSILESANINVNDIEAGLYDYAKITISIIDYTNISAGELIIKKGTLGNIKNDLNYFIAEIRGLSQLYTNIITKEYTPLCRAVFGDNQCGINKANYTKSGTINTVISDYEFATTLTDIDGYYNYGLITFTSGANAGRSIEVKEYLQQSGYIKIFLTLPDPVAVGDTFNIVAGCDKQFTTCKNKFANNINYRGEPLLPGKDRLITGK